MSERLIRGRLDGSGILVSADAPLLRLQQRAGAGEMAQWAISSGERREPKASGWTAGPPCRALG